MKRILFLFSLLVGSTLMAQDGSVGIGTQTPNEKAVLHLVAPNNDQGFLVPKLTTTQRNNFSSQLTSAENGMMVFDSDLNQFFFWLSDHWEAVGSSLQAGSGLQIVDGVITNTGDTDASDDFSGDWGDLANIPSEFVDGTDDVNDADADPNNELQDLNLAGNILTITGLTTPTQIDLSSYISVNTDEQDLLFSSGQISLSGDPNNTIIDLSNYDSDASDDFSGDWADLQNIPAAFLDGSIDDADNDPTNEIELPSTAATGQALKFDGTNWVAAADEIDDADNDPNNEIELPTTANLGEVLKFNDALEWAPATDQVDDADADPNNELQDLNLSGNILTITGIGSPTQVNLAAYLGTNTDEQDLQYLDGQISLTGDPDGTIIDLSLYDTDFRDDFSGSFLDLLDVPLNLDLNSLDDFSGSFLDLTDVPINLDLDVTDDFSGLFSDLTGVPVNLDLDVTDDFSGSFLDLTNVPVNLDLDVTDDFSGSFLDLTNVPVNLDLDATDDFSGSFEDLLDIPFYLDTDVTDDFSGSFLDLTDVPVNLDLDFEDDFSGSFLDLTDVPVNLDTDVTDDFSGSFLDLTNVPANLDLDATDDFSGQWGDLSGIPTGFLDGADDVDDADSDPNNEFQDLSFDPLTNTLSISNDPDGTPVSLSALLGLPGIPGLTGQVLKYKGLLTGWAAGTDEVDDADADPNNELQSLQFEGTSMWLDRDPDGTSVDLSIYNTDVLADLLPSEGQIAKYIKGAWVVDNDNVDDADNDPDNERQDLFYDSRGYTLNITNNLDASIIDLSGLRDNTDNQDLELLDGSLVLTNDDTPVSLNAYLDNTDNQNLELIDGSLVLTGDDTPVNLSAYFDNTDLLASIPADASDEGSVLKYFPADGGWQPSTDFVDDDDNDPNNENQTVSGGTGINVTQTGQDFRVVNTAPDQTVTITGSGDASVTGTYPNFNINVPTSSTEQYAFKAGKSEDQNITSEGKNEIVTFRAESYDLGDVYDAGTSIFTAKVPGIYSFSVTISTIADAGADLNINLIVDETQVHSMVLSGGPTSDAFSFFADVQLIESQKVRVEVVSRTSGRIVGKPVQTNWSGRLEMAVSK